MKTGILLSGGMDSLSLTWWKKPDIALTVNYGQLAAEAEVAASTSLCKYIGIPHFILNVDCSALGSGDMAGEKADMHAPASDWWPYRNQMLVTLAAMKAISLGVTQLWLGTVRSDGSHSDGTIEFVDSISSLMALQEGGLTIAAPAIELSTTELIWNSRIPADVLAWAHSCHKSNVPCGNCRGCNKYFEVLGEIGYDLDRLR